jgi:drug/metabolite transporter (DMT)-like permease
MLVAPLVVGRRFPGRTDALISVGIFLALLTTYVASTKETTAANAIFLQYTAPLYVVALGPMIVGERLHRSDAPAMAICLVGIVILFAGNQGSGDALGLWLGVAAGFFWGLFFLWLRRIRYADPVAITFLNCLGVALLLVVVPSVWDVNAEAIAMLAVMAAVQFALPYLLFTRGIQHVRGAEASLIALAEPVLNPIWVALIYGEQPSTATVIGGAVIVGGLAVRYTVFREKEVVDAA